MNCEICMAEINDGSFCPECQKDVVQELIKRKIASKQENDFLALLLKTVNMTHSQLIEKGRQKNLPIARSLHVVFLRNYLGGIPKKIMNRYGLSRYTYYNSIKIVQQLNLTRKDKQKYSELFTSYPKLLENNTIDYNKTTFGIGNSRSKQNEIHR